ncbi:hypothetical protein Acsp03_13290 [Actinomadura sp. NBRC 104412]|uniref:maleylpyruvate isomerase N-terminal domain-containing protein n=1 Tax=Actinomadura sp. NBRC 104412 TaxID=3032203 RepID=UPI00249FB6D0|nr:maleylpyruvate isomerase N-terminal domain-containing protein [Actinomadura sp. NBRC 104412]GLZ03863.1 hypothetical protein Acsp03_13290 [Actinomadura sp. NBRC 104412]
MTASHRDVAPLLAAWAIGACSPQEAALVREHLADCAECADESRRLIASTNPATPQAPDDPLPDSPMPGAPVPVPDDPKLVPGGLRARVLGAAVGRRAPAPVVPEFAAPYAAQVSVLDALLAELSAGEWATTVIYDWNVQDVVAHLSATDRLLLEQLPAMSQGDTGDADRRSGASGNDVRGNGGRRDASGLGSGGPGVRAGAGSPQEGAGRSGVEGGGGENRVEAYTAEAIRFERGRRVEETWGSWRSQARELCARLNALEAGRKVNILQPMRLDNAVVARAFETWVHSTDIAKVVGRNLPAPLPQHLHAIAALGVRALPAAWSLRGLSPEGRARVVLDGPGGGDWLVTLGGDGAAAPVVTLRMDALEFCMLAADRRDPSSVAASISGDQTIGRHLLEAAPAFAGP